jgi:3-hydroxy-9,10-secoandrosta-1,3,5(10)-triene-9,17-dione monooxygenase reductase component
MTEPLATRLRATDPVRVDPRMFRTVCGNFATGVAVVTSGTTDVVSGLTVNSFTSVSLDPPLILVCIHNESSQLRALRQTGAFAVNILAADQEDVCRAFRHPAPPPAAEGRRPTRHHRRTHPEGGAGLPGVPGRERGAGR